MDIPNAIVVIGASAGGLTALMEIVKPFNKDIDAAFFIVMHVSKSYSSDFILIKLNAVTTLQCEIAKDGTAIQKGHVYIGPANFHLLLKDGKILLGKGPEENRWRPSIDVLFRSAAAAYNSKVIGIIITGLLDDGTAGMIAVKRSGGICIVQNPDEAQYPDMVLSVIEHIDVDYQLPLSAMAETIKTLSLKQIEQKPVPQDILIESQIAENVAVNYERVSQLGEKSIYACPDCGGGLWLIKSPENVAKEFDRYRCHIGHAFSEKDLLLRQAEVYESTLWIALRVMEERRNLLLKMQNNDIQRGFINSSKLYQSQIDEMQKHIDKMRELLFSSHSFKEGKE